VASVAESDEVMFITQQGKVLRTPAGMISIIGRNTQGVRLIDMEPEDKAVSLARLEEQEADTGLAGAEGEGGQDGGTTPPEATETSTDEPAE
jgi:DNA gyrase subunit A